MLKPYNIGLKGDELQGKLGGGIPRNAFVLIEGPNGIGKSIFAQRIAYGLIKNDQSVTYVSSELGLTGFINQMASLRYDIKSAIVTKQLKFVTLFPAIGKIKLSTNLIDNVFSATRFFDSQVIIFDTLSDLLVTNEIDQKNTFDLISFFKRVVSMDKTMVFCVDAALLSESFVSLLRTVSDVYISLEEREQYGNKIKLMNVKRFSGAVDEVSEEIPFKVKAGIGIVVELAS